MWKRIAAAALLCFGAVACGRGCSCGSERDYLLVIDTSGSMVSHDTIDRVKQGMPEFLNSVDEGDSVTVVNFDARPKIGARVVIESDADRKRVVDQVAQLKASGAWTDMGAMVELLRAQTKSAASAGRESVVVVMSDGKDDPPPGARRDRLDLNRLRDPDADGLSAPYIYYISLGKIQDPALERSLRTIAPDARTIRANQADRRGGAASGAAASDPAAQAADQVGLTEVVEQHEGAWWRRLLSALGPYKWIILIALAALLVLILLVWLIWKLLTRSRFAGNLVYYEAEVGQPLKNDFDLNRLSRNRMTIGSKLGADLRVRSSGLPQNVLLKGRRSGGESYLVPGESDRSFFQFLSQKKEGLISTGDRFRLGNYIFEYTDGASGQK